MPMAISGQTIKIIDLHCDTMGRIADNGWSLLDDRLHFSIARRPKDIRVCQAAAIFIPDNLRKKEAQGYFLKAYDYYKRELCAHANEVCALSDLGDIGNSLNETPVAFFLTVEGGAVLGGELCWLDKLHNLGVKAITITWNGANEICGGCASGGGFTSFGKQAIIRMEEFGMAVDVSHLSDEGFWELCGFAAKPFCASHSNSRAVCNHRRNLTDDMFREIAGRGGVVGINYGVRFITEDGVASSIGDLLRHIHHFLELGGEDTVALGSDFDGTDIPEYLSGIEGLAGLRDELIISGIPADVADKILFSNANRYLSSLQKENQL